MRDSGFRLLQLNIRSCRDRATEEYEAPNSENKLLSLLQWCNTLQDMDGEEVCFVELGNFYWFLLSEICCIF